MYLGTFVAFTDIIPIPSPADSHRSFSPSDLTNRATDEINARGNSSVFNVKVPNASMPVKISFFTV